MADVQEEGPITVTPTEGLGSRLRSSCSGIIVGMILLSGSFWLFFWNEQRAVERYKADKGAVSQTIAISAVQINPENDGKIVHFTADVFNGGSSIIDSAFGVNCTVDCLSLQRHTSMYQWNESSSFSTETNADGSKTTETTYTYDKAWSDKLINSGAFYDSTSKYTNPSSMRFPSKTFTADPMMAGAFDLPNDIKDYIVRSSKKAIDVSLNDITDQSLKDEAKTYYGSSADGFYFGSGTDSAPEIGDQTVWFTETPPTTITVVGVQKDNTVTAFVSQKDNNTLLYKIGNYTIGEMYDVADGGNKIMTWVLRFSGFDIMYFGLALLANPPRDFDDALALAWMVMGYGVDVVAITCAAILSSIVISIPWFNFNLRSGGIALGASLGIAGIIAVFTYAISKDIENPMDDEGEDENEDSGDMEGGKSEDLPIATQVVPVLPKTY